MKKAPLVCGILGGGGGGGGGEVGGWEDVGRCGVLLFL